MFPEFLVENCNECRIKTAWVQVTVAKRKCRSVGRNLLIMRWTIYQRYSLVIFNLLHTWFYAQLRIRPSLLFGEKVNRFISVVEVFEARWYGPPNISKSSSQCGIKYIINNEGKRFRWRNVTLVNPALDINFSEFLAPCSTWHLISSYVPLILAPSAWGIPDTLPVGTVEPHLVIDEEGVEWWSRLHTVLKHDLKGVIAAVQEDAGRRPYCF